MWLAGSVGAVLLVGPPPQQPRSPESLSGLDMQWVRGTVVTATPTALALRVTGRTLNASEVALEIRTLEQTPPSERR